MSKSGPHFFFDFDSTIVTKESLDMVIERALDLHPDKETLVQKVNDITNRGMEGTVQFTDSVRERFAVVPLARTHFTTVGDELRAYITPGMEALFADLHRQNTSTYIISGGFKESILPVAEVLQVPEENVFTNAVLFGADGGVIGIDEDNVCFSDDGKAAVIAHIKKAQALEGECVMIGDGANDLKAYQMGVVERFCGFVGNIRRTTILENAPTIAYSATELRDFIFSQ